MPSFCLHAHFYQPPRGNPLADQIGADDVGYEAGAEPYENWNERSTAECYLPNAELGNFYLMSFDVGAALLRWMETHAPNTYRLILESDQNHLKQHGVGNALAVPAHHTILPLARKRDKATQVKWGIASFAHRFRRQPVGMWLPEMAVDLETLQVLHDAGIKFTILGESQVEGHEGGGGPYWVKLPNGDRFAVFVRDDELSNQIAFNIQMLGGAGRWARSTLAARRKNSGRLTLIAVEGETFGHHHAGEEHFLHWLLSYEANAVGQSVTTLERELRDNPPQIEIAIKEYTSWSCPHGLGRFAAGCDCTPPPSNWKGALRRALDNLANNMDDLYEAEAAALSADAWRLRDNFSRVVLGQADINQFWQENDLSKANRAALERLSALLAAEFFRQRMYTSSAFKHDDLSRPEPRYAIANGLRAAMLAGGATGGDLSPDFRRDLAQAVSNRSGQTGAQILDAVRAQV